MTISNHISKAYLVPSTLWDEHVLCVYLQFAYGINERCIYQKLLVSLIDVKYLMQRYMDKEEKKKIVLTVYHKPRFRAIRIEAEVSCVTAACLSVV